jgi:hypothetical protein
MTVREARRSRGLALAGASACALASGLWAATACDRLATNLSGGAGPGAGLLRGRLPADARGVAHAVRLTDGIAAAPGDPPQTDLTANFAARFASATWDLGAETPVRCALIDADGKTSYDVSVSSDGRTFAPLWTAGPDEDAGQQLRAGRDLRGSGRYLRLSAGGGAGHWSVSEVGAWRECPTAWPPLAMQKGTPDEEAVRLKLWAFGALTVAYVLAYRKRAPDWAKLLVVAPAGVGVALAVQIADLWPPPAPLVARLAVVAAAFGVALVARWVRARRTRAVPASRQGP